ncbi:complement C1q-like protein 4 [Babylonia areolata]|uniref:complement C1q-like protein 4 n=1 Tax=Babylonia areolata TaxID=304850 RepID=UPI003FD596DE
MIRCLVFLLLTVCTVYGQNGENEVSFSVGLTQHTSIPGAGVVVYNKVFNNAGNGYSNTTGKFTCPQSGVYVFQVHALAQRDADMWLELYHNFNYVMSLWGHTDNESAAAGNAVVLTLNKGDEVYVTGVDGYTSELYGTPTEIYVTFSGYLISPVFQEFPTVGGG